MIHIAKHNDKAFQDNLKLKMVFQQNLEKQLKNGLAQGTYAACKVIYDKASAEGKTAEEKLEDITEFCKVMVNSATKKDGA